MQRRLLSATVVSGVLAALLGGYVSPALASPVLATDTLRSGSGYAFGANDKGQTNPGSTSTTTLGALALPAGGGGPLKDAVSIAAGKSYAVWADHRGAVWAIGDNASGQSGNGSTTTSTTPQKAIGFGGTGQPKAVKVSAFGQASIVLDDAGAVWQWGNVVNSLGNNQVATTPAKVSFPLGTARIVDISAGSDFVLALAADGKAYSWGKNATGQLGQASTSTSPSPKAVTGLPALPSGASANLEAGRDFGVYTVSSSSGVQIWTWGHNNEHQLGNASSTKDTNAPALLPTTLAAPAKVQALSSGDEHTLLLTTDGVVRTWGDTELSIVPSPTVVADPNAALSGSHVPYTVAAGSGASFAVSRDGTVAAWGVDTTGQLGRTTTGTLTAPTVVTIPGTTTSALAASPAVITSRQGATYAVVAAEIARADQASYDLGSFSTSPASSQTPPKVTATFTNVSTKVLTGVGVTLAGANAGDFSLSGSTCAGALATDATCSVTVTFTPTAAGARAAALTLTSANTLAGQPLTSAVPVTGVGYTPAAGLANFALGLASGQPTTVSGPGTTVDLARLSPSLIPSTLPPTATAQIGRVPIATAQIGRVPFGLPQIGRVPFGLPQIGRVQIGRVPLGGFQIGRVPLPGLQIGRVPFGLPQIGRVQIGRVPLLRQGGWTALLQDYPKLREPSSSLTLGDLLDPAKNAPDPALNPAPAPPLERLVSSDIDWAHSDLAKVSMLSLITGGLRLDQFGGVDWCNDLPLIPHGGDCTDNNGLKRTLFELDLQGVDEGTTKAGSVTVGQLLTDSQSVSSNPVDDAVFGALVLQGSALGGTHVGAIALTALPNLSSLVYCTGSTPPAGSSTTDCTNLAGRTLGDPDVVAALRDTTTYGSLGTALNGITLGQLEEPFLDRASFNWELLERKDIPLAAYPNRLTYQADVDVNCFKAAGTTLGVQLPTGFGYVPGTATLTKTRGTGTVALADPAKDSTRGLVFSVPDSAYTSTGALACPSDTAHVRVSFGVLPSSVPGSAYRVSGDVRTTSLAPLTATQPGTVTVTGISNPPDDTPDGPPGRADQLVFGAITAAGQAQYVPFDAAPGKTIEATVAISPLTPDPTVSSDLDATLYYPVGTQVDPALSSATTPVTVPFGEAPAVEADSMHPLATTDGGALQDVPLLTDRPVAAVAATRGNVSEQLSAVAKAGAGNSNRHVLEIRGYNGGRGYYTARIRLVDAPSLGPCTTTPPPTGTSAATTYLNATGFAAGDNTAVLVDTARLRGRFGDVETTSLLSELDSFVHSGAGGVKGQVLQVDSDAGVRAAYAAWDAAPCDPLAADGVVRAIDGFVAANSPAGLKYVVVVGGDDMVPHARLEDHTRDGNEREDAGDLAINGNNALSAAFAGGYFLSDDPYGTRSPLSYLGQLLYVPQAITGRLGETPADMRKQLETFAASAGLYAPEGASTRHAVVTDYDFLTRGGQSVADTLAADGVNVSHLTGPSWTADDLAASWLGASTPPSIAALNMHYDQYRALPSAENTANTQNNLYTAQQVRSSAADLNRRLIFTIGCHSALDVPDSTLAGDARVLDFAQAYSGKGALMIGNLGYGYADTEVVAYNAKLQTLLTQGLKRGYDVGTALVEAKRAYVSQLSGLSAYDAKSAQQVILWGLPQARLKGTATFPTAAAPIPAPPADAAGLVGTGIPVTTSFDAPHPAADGSTYDSVGSQTAAQPGRPILPVQYVDVPQVSGMQLHSVVPAALTSTSAGTRNVTFSRPSSDHSQPSQPVGAGVYPAVLSHVGTVLDGTGTRSTLVVTPESMTMTGSGAGSANVLRFTSGSYTAYYGPAGAVTPPTITSVQGSYFGSGAGVTSYAVDVRHAAGRTIKRAYVLALGPADGNGVSTWVRTDLFRDTTTGDVRWAAATAGQLGQFYVVAVDDQGNAAVSTAKGAGWKPTVLAASYPAPVAVALSPAPPASGWYTGPVQVAPASGAPAGTTLSVDGAAPASSATVTGDGVHLVRVVLPDGTVESGAQPVLIDSQTPVLTVSALPSGPVELNQTVPYTTTVRYGASGPAAGSATTGTANANTGSVGAKTLVVTARSLAGLSSTSSQPYSVIYGQAGSRGFFSPVLPGLNDPSGGLNLVIHGAVYGFDYHLADHDGAPVDTGADTGNTATFTQLASCPGTANKVQLPKLSAATAQPVGQGGGDWDWNLSAPAVPASGSSCFHVRVLTNDGYTHFDADLQVS